MNTHYLLVESYLECYLNPALRKAAGLNCYFEREEMCGYTAGMNWQYKESGKYLVFIFKLIVFI